MVAMAEEAVAMVVVVAVAVVAQLIWVLAICIEAKEPPTRASTDAPKQAYPRGIHTAAVAPAEAAHPPAFAASNPSRLAVATRTSFTRCSRSRRFRSSPPRTSFASLHHRTRQTVSLFSSSLLSPLPRQA